MQVQVCLQFWVPHPTTPLPPLMLHVHKSTHTCLFISILEVVHSWECVLQDDASIWCTGCSLIQQTLLPPAACRYPCRHHSSYTCWQRSYTHSTTCTHPFAFILPSCGVQAGAIRNFEDMARHHTMPLAMPNSLLQAWVPAALPHGTASQARTATTRLFPIRFGGSLKPETRENAGHNLQKTSGQNNGSR
jgi:hypothetical protein